MGKVPIQPLMWNYLEGLSQLGDATAAGAKPPRAFSIQPGRSNSHWMEWNEIGVIVSIAYALFWEKYWISDFQYIFHRTSWKDWGVKIAPYPWRITSLQRKSYDKKEETYQADFIPTNDVMWSISLHFSHNLPGSHPLNPSTPFLQSLTFPQRPARDSLDFPHPIPGIATIPESGAKRGDKRSIRCSVVDTAEGSAS